MARFVRGRRARMVSLCRVPFLPWLSSYRRDFGDCLLTFDVGKHWVEAWGCRKARGRWSVLGVVSRRIFDQCWRCQQEELYMSFLDRIPPSNGSATAAASCGDEQFVKRYPAITEFLVVTVLPTGECRTASTLMLFWEEGTFKACLSERDRGLTLWGTGETLADCLKCLESRLASPKPEWRKQRTQGGKRK